MEQGRLRVRVTVTETEREVRASALDLDACGVGATRAEALVQVREAVKQRLEPEAVAPPSTPLETAIDIVVVDDAEARDRTREPDGPGSPA